MSKAVLVLDEMPCDCIDSNCPCCRVAEDWSEARCYAVDKGRGKQLVSDGRPTWCPLREPAGKLEGKTEHQHKLMDYYEWGFVNGWNAYRDQLIDEEDDDG